MGSQRQEAALAVSEVGEDFLGEVVDEHGAGSEDALEQLVVVYRSAPADRRRRQPDGQRPAVR